jgi:hypothetical protein
MHASVTTDQPLPDYILRIAAWLRIPVEDVAAASVQGDLLALAVAAAVDRMPPRPAATDALRDLVLQVGGAMPGKKWLARALIEWADAGISTPQRMAVATSLCRLCGVTRVDELDARTLGMKLADATANDAVVRVDDFELRRVANFGGCGRWVVVDTTTGDLGDEST